MGSSDPWAGALPGIPVEEDGELIKRPRAWQWVPIPRSQIQYIFIARKRLGKIVIAPWTKKLRLRIGQIYFRTPTNVYLTPYRTLAEIVEKLDLHFKRAHASVIANVQVVDWKQLDRCDAWLGYVVDKTREDVAVSDRHRRELRIYFQPPRRSRRKAK